MQKIAYSPDEILLSVLCMSFEVGNLFRYNRREWINFFEIEKKKYPELLECFEFKKDYLFSECPELEQAYSTLLATGLVKHVGTKPELKHRIEESAKKEFEKIRNNKFSLEDENNLEEIATDFWARFKASK